MDNLFIWLAAVLLTSAAVCSMIEKIKKKKKKKTKYFIIETVSQKKLPSFLYLGEGSFYIWQVNIFFGGLKSNPFP